MLSSVNDIDLISEEWCTASTRLQQTGRAVVNASPSGGSNCGGEVARGSSVSPKMCFPDVIGTAVNNSYSEQTGWDCGDTLVLKSNMQQPWRKPGRHTRSLSVFNHFSVPWDLVVLFLHFSRYSLSLLFKCPFFVPHWSPRLAHTLLICMLSTLRWTLHFFRALLKLYGQSQEGELKQMTASCPSILPSSNTFFHSWGYGRAIPAAFGQEEAHHSAAVIASVRRRQKQQRVCTSAVWIQSDAINIFPLRPLQHIL